MPMKPSKPSPGSRRVTSVPAAKRTPIGTDKPMTAMQRKSTTTPIPNAKGPRKITTNEKKIAAELSPKGMKKPVKKAK